MPVDPNAPLSDSYLLQHSDDPAIAPYLTAEEQGRLTRLRTQTAKPPMTDYRGRPAVTSDLSDAGTGSDLMDAMAPLAHPQGFLDVARLLSYAPVPIPASGTAKAAQQVVGGATDAVKNAPSAAVKAAGAVGDVIHPDVIGVFSPRLRNALNVGQRLRDRFRGEPTATPAPVPEAPPIPAPSMSFRLTPEESQAMQQLLQQGYAEADVLQEIVKARQGATQTATAAAKPMLKAAEAKEYQRLLRVGKTPKEAMDLIEGQRGLQQRMGLPSSDQTRRAVLERNDTGRWRD